MKSAIQLRTAAETLRVLCPTKYPVVIRRVKLTDHGDCELVKVKRRRTFKIRISSNLDIQFQIWVLVHEWAHAMTWDITHDRHPDHGGHFGIAYAEAYAAIYD